MRLLVQRASEARVLVGDRKVAEIGQGLLILACAMQGDGNNVPALAARKVANLRVFRDDSGRMNRSVRDVGGSMLAVSQFTLAADTSRGNRPGFSSAAPPEEGRRLFDRFVESLAEYCPDVQTGEFGADMKVQLTNDGPVTIWMDVISP